LEPVPDVNEAQSCVPFYPILIFYLYLFPSIAEFQKGKISNILEAQLNYLFYLLPLDTHLN
jgi:hypothetical protein